MPKDYARESHLVPVETDDSAPWLPGFSSSRHRSLPSDKHRRTFDDSGVGGFAQCAPCRDARHRGDWQPDASAGHPFRRLLQFVASGALGPSAFEGGIGTAIAGLALHFVVAGIWAAIYFTLADRWPLLGALPVLSGALYGVAIHVLMSRIVVPLSRAAKRPFSWKAWFTQLAIHIVCVGIPIAWMQ